MVEGFRPGRRGSSFLIAAVLLPAVILGQVPRLPRGVATANLFLRERATDSSGGRVAVRRGDTLLLAEVSTSGEYIRVQSKDGLLGWVWARRILVLPDSASMNLSPPVADALKRIEATPKQPPIYRGLPECYIGGEAALDVDRRTNRLKSRVDTAASYVSMSPADLRLLPEVNLPRSRVRWAPRDSSEVARFEGAPVSIEGYLDRVLEERPVCTAALAKLSNWSVAILADRSSDLARDSRSGFYAALTPQIRKTRLWSLDTLREAAQNRTRARVSGWLLFDPANLDRVGKSRDSSWELHPVTRIELWDGVAWRVLPE